MKKYQIPIFIPSLITFILMGCGVKDLKPLEEKLSAPIIPKSTIQVPYCTKKIEQGIDVVNFLVIDESTSNHVDLAPFMSGGFEFFYNATDPDRQLRYGSLLEFLQNREYLPHEYYILSDFGSQQSNGNTEGPSAWFYGNEHFRNNGEGQVTILTPENEFSPSIQNRTDLDSNPLVDKVIDLLNPIHNKPWGTPYHVPLKRIYDTIRDDAIARKQRHEQDLILNPEATLKPTHYNVFFITDGMPTCTGSNHYETDIFQEVDRIVDQLPNNHEVFEVIRSVQFHTAYYTGTNTAPIIDTLAKDLLTTMAERGRGRYSEFLNGENIDWDDIVDTEITYVEYDIDHVFVTNQNSNWSFESFLLYGEAYVLDSDGDGVPDIFEPPHCRDKVDCDGNGYSDLAEYMLFGSVCPTYFDPAGVEWCEPVSNRFASACELKDEDGKLLDSDGDGLTDCDEEILGTDKDRFDTNGNGIPDFLAVKYNIQYGKCSGAQAGPNGECMLQDSIVRDEWEGKPISNYRQIRHNLPVHIPNSQIPGLKAAKYDTRLTHMEGAIKPSRCYMLEVEDMGSVLQGNDNITVDLIMRETSGSGAPFYKRFTRKMENGNVVFYPQDFE